MTDRRRVNGPPGGTSPAVFVPDISLTRPRRSRKPRELRKIFLKTGITPSASGSAYFELEAPSVSLSKDLIPTSSSLKITCTVHGPKPLPRTASFSPNLLLTTTVKFAPFAARQRRGYIRDASERDLGVHLETALKGAIIADRWPKSAVDVIVTILEGEEDRWWGDEVKPSDTEARHVSSCGMMNVLAGCITVASAAIADARIDCLDMVAGGVAAVVPIGDTTKSKEAGGREMILDPCPAEHEAIESACVVGYLPSRDEITEIWFKGGAAARNGTDEEGMGVEGLIDSAAIAAQASYTVLGEAVKESAEALLNRFQSSTTSNGAAK